MILPFSVKFPNGQDTDFVGKIWAGLLNHDDFVINNRDRAAFLDGCQNRNLIYDDVLSFDEYRLLYKPKRHTIRIDKSERWHVGSKIHMVVFNRSKNVFQFAPVLECKCVQDIFITNIQGRFEISVDDKYQYDIDTIAKNDGFDAADHMRQFFFPKNSKCDGFKGKIIHWTDLKY